MCRFLVGPLAESGGGEGVSALPRRAGLLGCVLRSMVERVEVVDDRRLCDLRDLKPVRRAVNGEPRRQTRLEVDGRAAPDAAAPALDDAGPERLDVRTSEGLDVWGLGRFQDRPWRISGWRR